MDERWCRIEEFPEYEVSNTGKVKTLKFNRNRTLKPALDSYGYEIVSLYGKNTRKEIKVHKLVAELFVYNDDPSLKNTVNHKDGNKTNNHCDNLEWCSSSDNLKHAHKAGLFNYAVGEASNSKITENDVIDIKKMLSSGMTHESISKLYPISRSSVTMIANGKIWKHI